MQEEKEEDGDGDRMNDSWIFSRLSVSLPAYLDRSRQFF